MTAPLQTPTAAHRPMAGCLAPRRHPSAPESGGGKYSRLYPDLPPLDPSVSALLGLGSSGAVCDGGLAAADANTEAGWPFFGQYIAHDITADRSPLERSEHVLVDNQRVPRLNLECLYGAGPGGSPYMFDVEDPAKFLLGAGGFDLPRSAQGIAIIADPRNDSHLFMNQMQVALLRAHNAFVDAARAQGRPEDQLFASARQAMTWHYQWIVVEEFLPKLVGAGLMADLRSGAVTLPLPEGLSVPYEFADAAYRYGHSQIRQTYRINAASEPLSLFPDLLGFRPVPAEKTVDWALMFDGATPGGAQRSMRISERLPCALINMPEEVTGAVEEERYRSLANRDMRRGALTDLPSGEAVARAMGLEPLSRDQIGLTGWDGETPLWFYMAREADTLGRGDILGPVGGRLVAGVMLSLIERDPASYLALEPDWTPDLAGIHTANHLFTILDMLEFGKESRA